MLNLRGLPRFRHCRGLGSRLWASNLRGHFWDLRVVTDFFRVVYNETET